MSQHRKYSIGNLDALSDADIQAARAGNTRYSIDVDDLKEWFVESDYFKKLSAAEKALSQKALGLSEISVPWQIGKILDESKDTLFAYEVAAHHVSSDEVDAVVLSGALGADLLDEAKENAEFKDKDTEFSDNYTLEKLIAIGALSRSRESLRSIGSWFTIEEGQRRRRIGIGGDVHGDFIMIELVETPGPIVSPLGTTVSILPLEPTAINGYHSVELDIAEVMLRHATDSMNSQEKAKYYEEIANVEDSAAAAVRSRAFGDYGTSLERRFWLLDDDVEFRTGKTVESLLVMPANRELCLAIVSMSEGILFAQTLQSIDGGTEHIAEIYVPDGSIPDFINALRVSDMGRVSPREVEELIRSILLGTDQYSTLKGR